MNVGTSGPRLALPWWAAPSLPFLQKTPLCDHTSLWTKAGAQGLAMGPLGNVVPKPRPQCKSFVDSAGAPARCAQLAASPISRKSTQARTPRERWLCRAAIIGGGWRLGAISLDLPRQLARSMANRWCLVGPRCWPRGAPL